jgi:hypothetical protein
MAERKQRLRLTQERNEALFLHYGAVLKQHNEAVKKGLQKPKSTYDLYDETGRPFFLSLERVRAIVRSMYNTQVKRRFLKQELADAVKKAQEVYNELHNG